jgi:hypothetical protein
MVFAEINEVEAVNFAHITYIHKNQDGTLNVYVSGDDKPLHAKELTLPTSCWQSRDILS